ncbi:restriction endonuclease (plasmid) [Bacillus tropicus]|uniref:Restriction endonuclease n=1 Tax=Bacillus tropicus TaxID=2026188 RepID=A0A7T2QL34_9BACI|nr:restriction endonuclease [Bacillus tropicus]AJG91178.1 restriction endonuclease family protein [Bacillus cereus]QPR80626.1 restriction endonuclease [Bacillus tropicus]
MWGFFKRKKAAKLSKEERMEIYIKNKEEVIRRAKEFLLDFHYDFEFVSEDLLHVVFLDELSKKIAYIQFSSPEKEPNILDLGDIHGLGIRYNSEEISIQKESYENFGDMYSPEECANEFDFAAMENMNLISIFIKYRLNYSKEEEIEIPCYNMGKSIFGYEEKHKELKEMYQYLITCFIEYENKRIDEAKIEILNSIIKDLEKYRKKNSKLKDNYMPLIGSMLSALDDYITFTSTFDFARDFPIDMMDNLALSIKGYRDERLFIGCNYEALETFRDSKIKELIIRVIELELSNYGYKEVTIIPNQSELVKAKIEKDTSVQEQVAREIIHVLPSFIEGSYKSCTYYQETLFIHYEVIYGSYIAQTRHIIWDKNRLSILEYLIGDQKIKIAFVPPNHKVGFLSVENIEQVWNTVVHYTLNYGYYIDSSKETLLASKVYSYEEQVLSIYNVDDAENLTCDLIDNIKYAFFIHTGEFVDSVEITDNLEGNVNQEGDEENIPRVVADWIIEIESQPHALFKVFDLRHINGEIYVLMDNKAYVATRIYGSTDGNFRLPNEPSTETLTKRWLRINGGYISLGEWHYNFYDEEFASSIRKYLTDLDQVQKNQMEPWKQKYMENNTIQTLFERFYQKKIKPLIDATYLDDILDDTVNFHDEIETFTQFLMKKKYIEGDEFLVGVFVREQVVENAINDFSETFNLHNNVQFENISNMTLTECLQAFHAADFAMIENHEDVANFMCFLLKNNKIELDVTYQELQEKLTNMLMQEGEDQMLQDYGSYLLAEDEDNVSITLESIDEMDGYQFEEFVAKLFVEMGYKAEVTNSSGDYGIDVIAKRKGLSIGIQAKRYSDKVPNKAVQEVIAGISYYKLDQGLVITNNYFTRQAQNQAKGTNVLLWDRDMLQQKLHELYRNIEKR